MTPGQRRLEEFVAPGDAAAEPARPPPPRPAALPGIWQVDDGYVVHPLLAPRTVRALPFQLDLARIGISEDLLVVLPTGLGKTVIAALVAVEVLRRGSGKVLVLAPTRPLVAQHAESFARWIPSARRMVFTGNVRSPVRSGTWEGADAVFATPQIVAKDLAKGRYDLAGVGLVVFDEAHHAVGKYDYVPLAERYRKERGPQGRILGTTASPGGEEARIEEVVRALGVRRIEARTREDDGVREHVQSVDVETIWVDLDPTAQRIQALLEKARGTEGHALQKMGYLRKKPLRSLTVKDLLALRAEIFARPGPMTRKFGPIFRAGVLLHLHHASDRLETQGIEPFVQYVERVRGKEKPGRADRAFVGRPEVVEALRLAAAHRADSKAPSHPKITALVELVRAELAKARERPLRILVFAQYRDTIQGIQAALEAEGWTVGRFVGQATRDAEDPGMNQKEQGRILDAFRSGRFPVLVASSVAEEGLDVPDVDVVVFFESIPSEIRAIQRRGRTGRSSLGRVVLLLTRETRDVGYQIAEARRERAMGRIVRRLSQEARRRKDAEAPGEEPSVTPAASPRADGGGPRRGSGR